MEGSQAHLTRHPSRSKMSELSRAEKIAAAKKKLREFQAAKANKQSNESYVNEAHGFNVSGTGGYRVSNGKGFNSDRDLFLKISY
ncbi:unnamed protein product [Schistosoma haematobium]|nr:unnamed protein product [Schistosoma haematobium]